MSKFAAVILGTTLFSAVTQAEEIKHIGPKFVADASIGVLKVDGRDVDPWAFRMNAGFTGLYIFDSGLKVKYDLLGDFAGQINDTDNLSWSTGEVGHINDDPNNMYVQDAKVLFITPRFGAFVIAPRTEAGNWIESYSKVDIFEYNRFHADTKSISVFSQRFQGQDVLGYASPTFLGGFTFLIGTLHINDKNGADADATTSIIKYEKDGLFALASYSEMDPAMSPAHNNFSYLTLSAAYRVGGLSLAAVYERNSGKPELAAPPTATTPPLFDTWDVNSLVATASYDISPEWTVSLGYAHKDHEDNRKDLTGYIGNIRYHLSKSVSVFVEAGQYDGAPSNLMFGARYTL